MPQEQKNKPVWAEQITSLRKKLGISQTAMAARLSTSQSNVASWEAGRYKPSPNQLIEMAKMLPVEIESVALMQQAGVSADFFNGTSPKGLIPIAISESAVRDAERRRLAELAASGALNSMEDPVRHIPLLRDAAAAGTPRAVEDDAIERLVPVPRDWVPHGGELYFLRIDGDSMSPIVLDGGLVIVDVAQNDPRKLVNRMVLARDDGITVKWLRQDQGQFLLVPHNVSVRHPVRILSKGMSIVGRVIKWFGEPPEPPKKR